MATCADLASRSFGHLDRARLFFDSPHANLLHPQKTGCPLQLGIRLFWSIHPDVWRHTCHGSVDSLARNLLAIGGVKVSGLELQRELSGNANAVPIIFMTAHSDERVRERALEAGAVAFFQKPFKSEALLDAVHSVLK